MLLNAMGAHSVALEMMDAMQHGSHFLPAYLGGWSWTVLLVLPHSTAVNFAFPHLIGSNGEALWYVHTICTHLWAAATVALCGTHSVNHVLNLLLLVK